ncbi:hypothetical protein GOBAR_AA10159 [Gossypium barbadense]|uniref:Uncharacterized protein n=1 Tax=Gossypium barbadense TaxID=3634 RepID=A0A2P5Y4F7_GOSBA|nr:hypothetical protein GOBAR_AA10159 [Gossypium barbadense]
MKAIRPGVTPMDKSRLGMEVVSPTRTEHHGDPRFNNLFGNACVANDLSVEVLDLGRHLTISFKENYDPKASGPSRGESFEDLGIGHVIPKGRGFGNKSSNNRTNRPFNKTI